MGGTEVDGPPAMTEERCKSDEFIVYQTKVRQEDTYT
jgi:hypothetical protein